LVGGSSLSREAKLIKTNQYVIASSLFRQFWLAGNLLECVEGEKKYINQLHNPMFHLLTLEIPSANPNTIFKPNHSTIILICANNRA
jgi:hypothetical protein